MYRLLVPLFAAALFAVGASARAQDVPQVSDAAAARELGKLLFFDKRLSGDASRACAGCHLPDFGWTDREPLSLGVMGRRAARNAPTVVDVAQVEKARALFRDGRVSNLTEFVVHPVTNPSEMNSTPEKVASALSGVTAYRELNAKAFGAGGLSFARVSVAIASFLRTLKFAPSDFSKFMEGKKSALSERERRGFEVFLASGCATCHAGARLTDDAFHAIGTGKDDPGRFGVTGKEADRGAFRTPTLLNVKLTPPYFHDGSAQTLDQVLKFYERAPETPVDPLRRVLKLEAGDRSALLVFLESLDATEGGFEIPEVPGQ